MPAEKFEQIYESLKGKIENGTYPADSFLPSENRLTELYGCSRNTVRRAAAMLEEEGYVQAIHGKGVRILYAPSQQNSFTVGGIESFAESAKRNHYKVSTKVVRFGEILVDRRTAARTGFREGETVFYVQRVRSLDGRPVILDINVFLKSEMPGLTAGIASKSVYRYLEDELGMQIMMSNRKITAERATQADGKYLDLRDYDFVSVITGQTYDAKGTMFEWMQSRHRPDYFVFYDTARRKAR